MSNGVYYFFVLFRKRFLCVPPLMVSCLSVWPQVLAAEPYIDPTSYLKHNNNHTSPPVLPLCLTSRTGEHTPAGGPAPGWGDVWPQLGVCSSPGPEHAAGVLPFLLGVHPAPIHDRQPGCQADGYPPDAAIFFIGIPVPQMTSCRLMSARCGFSGAFPLRPHSVLSPEPFASSLPGISREWGTCTRTPRSTVRPMQLLCAFGVDYLRRSWVRGGWRAGPWGILRLQQMVMAGEAVLSTLGGGWYLSFFG